MDKYKNKYRIPTARHQNWDYGWKGAYFITICTEDKHNYFGEIIGSKMHLSPIGVLADVFWYEIKNHTQNTKLDAFIVMPNHVHGILILTKNNNATDTNIEIKADADLETRHALSLSSSQYQSSGELEMKPIQKSIGQKRFRNPGKNTISSIIGGYKSAVTKHARRIGFEFGWQPRFHDHIIRNKLAFYNIAEYIHNNPRKWKEDKFYN